MFCKYIFYLKLQNILQLLTLVVTHLERIIQDNLQHMISYKYIFKYMLQVVLNIFF